jgi:hypothetical protein
MVAWPRLLIAPRLLWPTCKRYVAMAGSLPGARDSHQRDESGSATSNCLSLTTASDSVR